MSAKKISVDWDGVKRDYLKSTDSIRDLADFYCVSEGAIRKRAKAEGWGDRPKPVRTPPKCVPALRTVPAKPEPGSEAAAQAAEPSTIADAGRGLVSRMLDELDAVTTHQGELEEMILAETAGDQNGKRQDAMLGAVSLAGRAKTLKELATAFKTLNEASAPQGKKAAQGEKAAEVMSRIRSFGPPKLVS